jgi:Protein of unknown function (DUF3617)
MDRGGMQKIMFCGAFVAAIFFVVFPARAEIKLDPGTWQQVESGTENGKPAKPVTYTDCLTPAEAKDPIKAIANLKQMGDLIGQHCKKLEVHQDADTVSVDFACGDEKTTFIGISLVFKFVDARHYTGTVKSTFVFKGRKTTSDKAIEAKWLGAECEKK